MKMMHLFNWRVGIVLFFLLFVGPFTVGAAQPHDRFVNLFTEVAGTSAVFQSTEQLPAEAAEVLHAAKRFRHVVINPQAIKPKELVQGDILRLGLFEDVDLYAKVDEVTLDVNGVYGLTARVKDDDFGFVLLSILNGKVLGSIVLPEQGREFQISHLRPLASHVLQEVEPSRKDYLLPGPPQIFPGAPGSPMLFSPGSPDSVEPANQQTIIDVMIVYTPAARNWAASNATSIAHVVNQAMQRSNLVLNNSRVGFNIRLVRSALVNYAESSGGNDSGTDLDHLTNPNSGQMDIVHTWRNQSGADLVHILTLANDTGGLGWLLQNRLGNAAQGFALTRVQQAHNGYTVIHEIGHNMGAHHHREQNVQPGPTRWANWAANTWSAGWRWVGQDGRRYCDVMTYTSGQYFRDGQTHIEVPFFSNPNISFQGRPAGHATLGDNARTLREVRNVVANYRSAPNRPAVMTSPANGSTLPGATVTFRWSNVGAAVHAIGIGTSPGARNIAFRSAPGTATSLTFPNLPTNGSMIYVRLFTRHGTTWTHNDYTYRASSGGGGRPAVMTSPANGSTLPGATVTFRWSNVGAAVHAIGIGTSPGARNIAFRSAPGTATSLTFPNLPTNGSMIYVRLFTRHGTTWMHNDYQYRASSGGGGVGFFERFERHPVGWLQDSGSWRNASRHWYTPSGRLNYWNTTTFHRSYTNVDFSAALARSGSQDAANVLIVRGSGAVLADGLLANGYFFQYTRQGGYSVWKRVNGRYTALKGWERTPHIRVGGAWNVLRAVVVGNNLAFYINGNLVWRGTDSSLQSGRVGMSLYRNQSTTDQTRMDWARLAVPGSGADMDYDLISILDTQNFEEDTYMVPGSVMENDY